MSMGVLKTSVTHMVDALLALHVSMCRSFSRIIQSYDACLATSSLSQLDHRFLIFHDALLPMRCGMIVSCQ